MPDYAKAENGKADIRVQFQKNIQEHIAVAEAQKYGIVLGSALDNQVIVLRIAEADIQNIAHLPWVFYIDAASPPSIHDDARGRSLHRSNSINSDLLTGRHYNGSGVAAALADDGLVGPHIDFTGRITNHVLSPGGNHGDMTSGILAGAGNLNPVNRGMADGVQLHVFDIGGYPQIVDAVTNNTTLGTVVSSTSYSQGCNEYTTDTQFGDQTTRDNPQLLFVFSAGNNQAGNCNYGAGAGWGNITGGYKQGKNVIACANLNAMEVLDNSSSRGPASDGRIKPDISSNGAGQISTDENNTYQTGGGTSAACPGIAGISTQLIQAYKELNSAANAPTALIKACMLNSAEDIGNPGPDYTYGWGRVNALRAVQTLEDNRYVSASISQGGTNTHSITVPANVVQMRVMIYWHDQGGVPLSSIALVNDLDMQVVDPSTTAWDPWVLDPTPVVANLTAPATRASDHLNNMEQVTIDNPVAGSYDVVVNGFAVPAGPQEYYLVYEFRTDEIIVTYPAGGEGFVPFEQEVIRWDAIRGISTYDIDYSVDDGATWISVATGINANIQQYLWNIPNNVSGEVRVRVSRGAVSGMSAEKFAIIGLPTAITVDWACPDSVRLVWIGVTGAAWYEISMLGATHMDSVGTSVTTDFVVPGTNPVDPFWFSVRAVLANGSKGRRANAVFKGPGTSNCPLAFDLQMNAVLSPGSGTAQDCQDLSALPIMVEIENRGLNSVSMIPITYRLNGGPVVTDTFPGTLAPLQIATHTFPGSLDYSTAGNYTFETWIDYGGDQNLYNDSGIAVTTVVAGAVATLPFFETFETFTLCSTASNCEQDNCNMSNGWINEANLDQDDIDFRTDEGGTPSANTGPTIDHTTGTATGNYLYTEASNGCTNRVAHLVSPCIDLTTATNPVMFFWYHLFGANMGSLHVDVLSNGIWINDVITPLSGNLGNLWQQQFVNIFPYAGQIINIRFRGITGNDFASDMAIDDVNITDVTGIQQISSSQFISVYPNPSSGIFNLNISSLQESMYSCEVHDMNGKLVKSSQFNVRNNYREPMDLSGFPKGIYSVSIKNENSVYKTRITIL